jgi:enoyl-CoA hydratase
MGDMIVEYQSGWVQLTLNRPEVRNALNTALLGAVADCLAELGSDKTCRAVLICGAEENFAAGADISEIAIKTSAEAALDPRKSYWQGIRDFKMPIIAAIDGYCLGGGFELALMADLIVVGETAKLGLPETNLGLIPGAGGGQRLLARVGRARATRMIMMGEIIDAETAEAWGIASWRVAGSAVPEAEKICTKLASRAPLALQAAKQALIQGEENALALSEERQLFEALLDSDDKREGIAAFQSKRKPEFTGR